MSRLGLLRSLMYTQALENVEPLELRMAHIEGLVVAGPMVCGPECLGLRPRFKDGAVLPHCVGRIKRVILGFGAFEQVEFDEARHLVEMTVARQPDFLECFFGPLGDRKRFIAMNIVQPFWFWACAILRKAIRQIGGLDQFSSPIQSSDSHRKRPFRRW